MDWLLIVPGKSSVTVHCIPIIPIVPAGIQLEVVSVGRGESPRLQGLVWSLQQETAWPGMEEREAVVYFHENFWLSHSGLRNGIDVQPLDLGGK